MRQRPAREDPSQDGGLGPSRRGPGDGPRAAPEKIDAGVNPGSPPAASKGAKPTSARRPPGATGNTMDLKVDLTAITVVSVVFLTSAIIVATVFLFLHRGKELKHATIRLALEKGQPLPAALLSEGTRRPPVNDLAAGVKALFIGVGLGLFFWSFQPQLWAVGLIPAFVGLGHVAAWYVTGRNKAQAPAPQ